MGRYTHRYTQEIAGSAEPDQPSPCICLSRLAVVTTLQVIAVMRVLRLVYDMRPWVCTDECECI